jgi:hypothetical protein
MHERPIGDLVDALRGLGCTVEDLGQPGYPPLRITGPDTAPGPPIRVRGDVSSQFLTALLMALPLVAQRDMVIEVVGELISKPYIEITLNLLARFGIAGAARRLAALHHSRRQPAAHARGAVHVEGRRVGGVLLHRAGRHCRHAGCALAHRGRGQRGPAGRRALCRLRTGHGRVRPHGPQLPSRCAAAPGRSRRSTSTAWPSPTPP